MGASLGCSTRPMSVKRRRAIAEADAQEARYGLPDTRPRDVDPDVTCPHGRPGCTCDGQAHSAYWGLPR